MPRLFSQHWSAKTIWRLQHPPLAVVRITFSRDRRFTEPELVGLEILIGNLFYPLRNALRYQQAVQSSMRDPLLTSVGNREALSQALTREIELAKRFQRPFGLMLVDVDDFKQINDTAGHVAGDKVLQHLAEKLTDSVRQIDEVFRYGGEEFVVILGNTAANASLLVAERVRRVLEAEPPELDGSDLRFSVSIDVSMYRPNDTSDAIFERADQALYQAKETGRNRVVSDVCAGEPER